MHNRTLFGGATLLALAVLSVSAVPAGASAAAEGDAPVTEPTIAVFEAGRVDLSKSWEDAQVCMIWRSADTLECFRTPEQADAKEASIKRELQTSSPLQDGVTSSEAILLASCSSPLRLFQDTYYNGRELRFYDKGYWQNLDPYGFNDELSSYKVGACSSNLAEHSGGTGYWYPGNTSAGASEPVMAGGTTGWNDRVSSIRVN